MLDWLERLYHDLATGRRAVDHPLMAWVLEAMHVAVVLAREVRRDRLHVRAAMLAYWTAVAIVPILLVAFSVAGPLGLGETSREAVRSLLWNTILAESVEDVGKALDVLLDTANFKALGIVGIGATMAIGAQLYFNAELAYNDIFRTRVRRSLLLRFSLFYVGLTIAPVLVAAGFVATAWLPDQVNVFARAVPVLLTSVAMIGAIRVLPYRPVRWRSSILGGLFSAVLFEAAKVGFGAYTDLMGTADSMAGIYGSLAFLPAFLIWLYVLWMTVLVGVEMAYLTEHYDVLVGQQRREATDPFSHHRHPDALFAIGIMGVIARSWLDGKGALAPDELVQASGADPQHVQTCLEVLQDAGLLVETQDKRFVPARPPTELSASDIIERWRDTAAAPLPTSTASEIVEHTARAARRHLSAPGAWIPGTVRIPGPDDARPLLSAVPDPPPTDSVPPTPSSRPKG